MAIHSVVIVGFVFGSLASPALLSGAAPASAARAPAASPATQPSGAGEMIRAAGEVVRQLQVQEEIGGVPIGPHFIALKMEWSRHHVDAVRESRASRAEEVAALRAHLERAKQTLVVVEKRYRNGPDPSLIPVEIAKYFLAEAQLWAGPAGAAAPSTGPAPAAEMLRAAEKVLALLDEQVNTGGRALDAPFLMLQLDWSRRRVQAVRETRPGPQAESAALQAHVKQAKRVHHLLEERWKVGGDASLIPVE